MIEAIQALIDNAYGQEDGVDETTHLAILDLITVSIGTDVSNRVDCWVEATDGRFYFNVDDNGRLCTPDLRLTI